MMDILDALEGNDRGRNKQNILNWGYPNQGIGESTRTQKKGKLSLLESSVGWKTGSASGWRSSGKVLALGGGCFKYP